MDHCEICGYANGAGQECLCYHETFPGYQKHPAPPVDELSKAVFEGGKAKLEALANSDNAETKQVASDLLTELKEWTTTPENQMSVCCNCGQNVPAKWLDANGNCC